MSGRAVFLWVVPSFAALCALGLWLTREVPPPAVALPPDAPVLPVRPAPPAPAPPPPTGRVEPSPPPAPAALPEEEPIPEPPPGTWSREEVRVALQAVGPRVRQCLSDAELRHRGPQTATVRFTLQAGEEGGRFQGGEVVDSSLRDPFVFACIEDAFAETQFSVPPGRPPLLLTQPFHSRSRQKGVP